MKISELIQKLSKALKLYGDKNVTVSETLWLYNDVKSVRYIKHPYKDSDETVVEITDYESDDNDKEFYEKI